MTAVVVYQFTGAENKCATYEYPCDLYTPLYPIGFKDAKVCVNASNLFVCAQIPYPLKNGKSCPSPSSGLPNPCIKNFECVRSSSGDGCVPGGDTNTPFISKYKRGCEESNGNVITAGASYDCNCNTPPYTNRAFSMLPLNISYRPVVDTSKGCGLSYITSVEEPTWRPQCVNTLSNQAPPGPCNSRHTIGVSTNVDVEWQDSCFTPIKCVCKNNFDDAIGSDCNSCKPPFQPQGDSCGFAPPPPPSPPPSPQLPFGGVSCDDWWRLTVEHKRVAFFVPEVRPEGTRWWALGYVNVTGGTYPGLIDCGDGTLDALQCLQRPGALSFQLNATGSANWHPPGNTSASLLQTKLPWDDKVFYFACYNDGDQASSNGDCYYESVRPQYGGPPYCKDPYIDINAPLAQGGCNNGAWDPDNYARLYAYVGFSKISDGTSQDGTCLAQMPGPNTYKILNAFFDNAGVYSINVETYYIYTNWSIYELPDQEPPPPPPPSSPPPIQGLYQRPASCPDGPAQGNKCYYDKSPGPVPCPADGSGRGGHTVCPAGPFHVIVLPPTTKCRSTCELDAIAAPTGCPPDGNPPSGTQCVFPKDSSGGCSSATTCPEPHLYHVVTEATTVCKSKCCLDPQC